MSALCLHLDRITFTDLPEKIVGCEECLKIGSGWLAASWVREQTDKA